MLLILKNTFFYMMVHWVVYIWYCLATYISFPCFRSKTKCLEGDVRELQVKSDRLTGQLAEKECEFEARLKSKVEEWKTQWDAVEDNLQAEISTLKEEVRSILFISKHYCHCFLNQAISQIQKRVVTYLFYLDDLLSLFTG